MKIIDDEYPNLPTSRYNHIYKDDNGNLFMSITLPNGEIRYIPLER